MENEIKVKEYIRTNDGRIYKLEYLEDEIYLSDKFYNNIAKHSENIIDLVEIGDYVNGYIVLDVVENLQNGELHLEMPMDYTNKELGDCTIYNKEIETVVTKEQFESISYKVERKD